MFFFLLEAIILTKELSDNFDLMKTLVGLVIRIILSIKSFILSIIIVFKILAENEKKSHVSPLKGNNSYMESSDNFDPWETFADLIIRIISAI